MPAGNAKFLMDSVFELAQRLNQFHLSDAEIGIFCAVVIITPDRPGLRNPELVQKMQNKLKSVLSNILLPQHSDSPGIFSELLSMVHDLRTLNTLHTEKFLQTCKISSELDGPSKHYLCSSNSPPPPPKTTGGAPSEASLAQSLDAPQKSLDSQPQSPKQRTTQRPGQEEAGLLRS
ncbi:Ecdysone-induced protein E75a, partial [Caligus rogercresseyi]